MSRYSMQGIPIHGGNGADEEPPLINLNRDVVDEAGTLSLVTDCLIE